jgi:hypothetical protein
LLELVEGNFRGADVVGTLHDMRFVFLENDTKLLFATAYDGEWDAYIDDFVTKIPTSMDSSFCNLEGWPGIRHPRVKDWLVKHQITADAWYVANPNLTGSGDATARPGRQGGRRIPRQAFLSRGESLARGPGAIDPDPLKGSPMSSVTESVGASVSTAAPTLELQEIQADRPQAEAGSLLRRLMLLLRIDDARAGREFIRRLAPHIASATNWWKAATAWLEIGISYAGLEALGLPKESLHSFPRGVSLSAWLRRARQLGDDGVNDPRIGKSRSARARSMSASVHSAIPRKSGAAPSRCSRAIRGLLGRQRARHAGLRRAAGRSQFARVQRRHRPAGDRGQRRRAAAWLRSADQSRRVHPWLSGRGRDSPADAAAGHLGRNGTYAGFRKYQTRVGAFNRFLRANGSTEEERELVAAKLVGRWRSGAPLTLAPDVDNPTLGADPKRNNDFDYAKDPHGRQIPFGAHIRRMNPRDTELTASDRCQSASPHPARHDVWTALRSECAVRSR